MFTPKKKKKILFTVEYESQLKYMIRMSIINFKSGKVFKTVSIFNRREDPTKLNIVQASNLQHFSALKEEKHKEAQDDVFFLYV